MKHFKYLIGCFLLLSCSAAPLKYEKTKELEVNTEFDKAVKIEEVPASAGGTLAAPALSKNLPPKSEALPEPKATPSESEKNLMAPKAVADMTSLNSKPKNHKLNNKKIRGKRAKDLGKEKKSQEPALPLRRQPEFEDDVGFQGRRPIKDPFRVGEVITHEVSYFKTSAGNLRLKVEPMVNVNGRKAYNFVTEIATSPMYSHIYSVDDRVETFVDYETLVPSVYSLHVKESGQLREARMLFDDKTSQATYWEKKVTKKSGVEEKKQSWDILPYSQNVFSAIFYMRNFQWEPGKEIAFRVADDEQNLIFKGKCIRRERIETELGEKDAVVIKPEVILKGAFKPVGDIYIWLSDDEHHYPLRIESKIKIGTLVSEIISLIPGHN
ncbi:MAG: DUF3108 domain-containing protein [Pseudobdellovibrionaceae bacterium]